MCPTSTTLWRIARLPSHRASRPSSFRTCCGSDWQSVRHDHHEHYSYLSLRVQRIAEAGLAVVDVEELPTHGGSLRLWLRTRRAIPRHGTDRAVAEAEAGLETLLMPASSSGQRPLSTACCSFCCRPKRKANMYWAMAPLPRATPCSITQGSVPIYCRQWPIVPPASKANCSPAATFR